MIIGCDFHRSGQQVYGIESKTSEIFADGWIGHGGGEVDEFYGSLPAGAEVGVEASGNLRGSSASWRERLVDQQKSNGKINPFLTRERQRPKRFVWARAPVSPKCS